MKQLEEWPEWVNGAHKKERGLPVDHLPDAVVGHPFLLAVDMSQDEDDPRTGHINLAVNFGGSMNEPMSAQEIEYVVESVRYALESLAGDG